MWLKPLIIFFLFYIFAMLQNSFFAHFNLFGAIPNFIFITFFMLVFFGRKNSYYHVIFYAISAGLFLDIFSFSYLGVSMVLLIIIGCFIKKVYSSLKEKDDRYPFVYFLSLFFISLITYDLLIQAWLRFFDPSRISADLGLSFFAGIIYNLFFAILGFVICKKIIGKNKS
jgi:rod shape-determining protein MreD